MQCSYPLVHAVLAPSTQHAPCFLPCARCHAPSVCGLPPLHGATVCCTQRTFEAGQFLDPVDDGDFISQMSWQVYVSVARRGISVMAIALEGRSPCMEVCSWGLSGLAVPKGCA